MSTKRDYYEILGTSMDADEDTIKKSYRRLALKYHPDRNPGDRQAEEKFKEAAEAYEVLRDREKRRIYDNYGHEGLKGTGFTGFGGFEDIFSSFGDIFEDFFGFGTRQSRKARARRGNDLRYNLELTLEEAYKGKEEEIVFETWESCDMCGGSGVMPGSDPEICPTCHGEGEITRSHGFFQIRTICSTCNGTGQVIVDPCPKCKGKGKIKAEKKVLVKIPPGVDTGIQLRIKGEGEAGEPGGQPGDLFVVVYVKDHEFFSRDGDDLRCQVPISFIQAALGAEISIPILGNSKETNITISEGVQPGEIIRLKGLGMTSLRRVKGVGDLFIQLIVTIPTKLNKRQRELLMEFGELEEKKLSSKTKNFWGKMKGM